jgi:hypothetical protein
MKQYQLSKWDGQAAPKARPARGDALARRKTSDMGADPPCG